MSGRKIILYLCMIVFLFCNHGIYVHAEEADERERLQKQMQETWMPDSKTKEIDQILEELFPDEEIHFQELVEQCLHSEQTIPIEKIGRFFMDFFFGIIRKNKPTMVFLFGMSLVAALFANFSNVFKNKQITTIGFYAIYLLMITICLKAFSLTIKEVETSIENLLVFMRVFSPIYFLGMSIAVGSVSAIAFYNIVIFLIYLVEIAIFRIGLPFIHIYFILQILNFLSEEDMLSKFGELIKLSIEWLLKILFACVTGVSLVEGLLTPAIDVVKRNALTKGVEMIPGIGDIVGGTGEIVLGVAVLMKNGIGVAGAVVISIICMIPVFNILVLMFLYKCLAALIQPIADKRYVEAISSMGDGYQLLLKIAFTTALLFLITIAVAIKAAT